MQFITSRDNAKLKAVRGLVRSKKEREESSCFVMEGVRALNALLDGSALPQYTLREIWRSEKAPEMALGDVPVYCIPHEFMEQLSDCHTSQGILGIVHYDPAAWEVDPERGNYLLLDRLMDPGNAGTLIRSAVAFGFQGVFLYGDCVEVFNPKTVRSTMGALPFIRHWNVGPELFPLLERCEYEVISTVIHGGEKLNQMSFGAKNVLVIGSEAHGVGETIQARATRSLSIPMSGNIESLNAGVAGSICMCAIGAF